MTRLLTACATLALIAHPVFAEPVQVGARPGYLVGQMTDGPLKEKLASCLGGTFGTRHFSIAHRGAPLMFPEHSREGDIAAAGMGAGILECDVTFTKDKQLVCRHAQNDLHTSTNILATDLAAKCTKPFTPAAGETEASAECRTSDLTLAEFTTLKAKMDGANPAATTVEGYMDGTANWRTDLYADADTLLTLDDYIALVKSMGLKFTPELKEASVEMPFDGLTQEAYAQKLIDAFKAAGVPAADVWAQSFNLDDILYWIKAEPDFGAQAVYLIDPDAIPGFDNQKPETWTHDMADLKSKGVNYIAPPIFVLLTVKDGEIVPSAYAEAAKAAGLKMITWSLERSGPLRDGGGWYYTSLNDVIHSDGMMYEVVDVLAQQVGVSGIFSDWPATVTFYANCMNLD